MGDLTDNFSASEFACPCCGESKMDPNHMAQLQRFREIIGIKFSPVSGGGYRCRRYGELTSAHREGKATDPGLPRDKIYEAVRIAMALGFSGIGVKQKNGRWQLHLDTAGEIAGVRPRPWFWTY
jgi:hypothetical protein